MYVNKLYEIIMGKILDLSALKNKVQSPTTTAARSISLWATVKSNPVAETPLQNTINKTQVVERQQVPCACPAPTTESQESWTIIKNTVNQVNSTQNNAITATPIIQKVAEWVPTQKAVETAPAEVKQEIHNNSATPTVDSTKTQVKPEEEEEEEWKKTMISLNTIKSNVTAKKIEEEKTKADEEKKQEQQEQQEQNTLKKVTVVAPAMKIPWEEIQGKASISSLNSNTESNLSAINTEEKNDWKIDLWELKVETKPVDKKLVAEKSAKLRGQIEKDLLEKEKEENEKKNIKIDDDIFDNYKPKYGGKEEVKKKANWEEKPVFKKHLSAKKRNILIAWLLLFVLWISAAGYIFFNNSSSSSDDIQAIAVENNIAQTKENVEKIIENGKEEESVSNEGREEDKEIDDTNVELDEEDDNIEENQDWVVAQAEDSWESKVKNYLLNNYYK
jgi:hypothetical protein